MALKAFTYQACHKSLDRQCYDVPPASEQELSRGHSHPSLTNTPLAIYGHSLGEVNGEMYNLCLGYSCRPATDRLMVISWSGLNFNINKLIQI